MSETNSIGSAPAAHLRAVGTPSSAGIQQGAAHTPCFVAGTLIKTQSGEKRVEDIVVGDEILTRDNGYQPVTWCAARTLSVAELRAVPDLRPVHIAAGSMGSDLPERDLCVSPQHRMMLRNRQIRDWFGTEEVLIAAQHLRCYGGIDQPDAEQPVTYVHFMFAQHEIVLAEGCWSESFCPFVDAAGKDTPAQIEEIIKLFPELADAVPSGVARPVVGPEALVGISAIAAE